MDDLIKSSVITPSKPTYSLIILNAIKEGIFVIDKNFQIKWHNKYIKSLFGEDKNDK